MEGPKVSRLCSTITKYSGTASSRKTQAAIYLLLYFIRLLTAEERIENKRNHKDTGDGQRLATGSTNFSF